MFPHQFFDIPGKETVAFQDPSFSFSSPFSPFLSLSLSSSLSSSLSFFLFLAKHHTRALERSSTRNECMNRVVYAEQYMYTHNTHTHIHIYKSNMFTGNEIYLPPKLYLRLCVPASSGDYRVLLLLSKTKLGIITTTPRKTTCAQRKINLGFYKNIIVFLAELVELNRVRSISSASTKLRFAFFPPRSLAIHRRVHTEFANNVKNQEPQALSAGNDNSLATYIPSHGDQVCFRQNIRFVTGLWCWHFWRSIILVLLV